MKKRKYSLAPARLRAAGRFRYVMCQGEASLRSWNVSRDEMCLPERIGGRALIAIGREAFYQTNARRIVLPGTVCKIGARAFAQSPRLQAVRIPAGVQLIDRSAFGGSENVVLEVEPGSYAERYARVMGIRSVCGTADCDLTRRRSLRWGDWICRMTEEDTVVLREYCGSDAVVDVPARVNGLPVVRLDDWCFDSCAFLEAVNIPEGVTSLGRECFARCTQLHSVSLPDSLQWLGAGAFANCIRLRWIGIPDQVRSIPPMCFINSGLRQMHLPGDLRHIGNGAFSLCRALREAVLPPRTQKVEMNAFRDCDELQQLTMNEGLTWVGGDAFAGCSGLYMPALPASLNPACRMEFRDCIGAPEDLSDGD